MLRRGYTKGQVQTCKSRLDSASEERRQELADRYHKIDGRQFAPVAACAIEENGWKQAKTRR